MLNVGTCWDTLGEVGETMAQDIGFANLVTTRMASTILSVPESRLRYWVKLGCPARKLSTRGLFFVVEEVRNWVQSKRIGATM